MSKQEFYLYDSERLSDDGMTATTVIAATRMATLALFSPEVMGAQNEVTVHEPNGKKYPAPRGGFLGSHGYAATHLEADDDDSMIEVTPRMSAEHITEFGDFLGDKMVATGLLAPRESGVQLHDFSNGEYTVTQVAAPRRRTSIDEILADMELAPERLEEESRRLNRVAPVLALATQEFPAA